MENMDKGLTFLREVKFIYSEKATKFCEISTLDLTVLHTVKSKEEISQTFVAFSEYMNFMKQNLRFGPVSASWSVFEFMHLFYVLQCILSSI